MFRLIFLLLAFTSLRLAAFGEGAEHWTTLKVGMSPTEIVGALGQPLVQTSGRGYVLWIYDRCGEVLFFRGPVVA